MPDFEFFDDSFEPTKPKGKFHHHICQINNDNMAQMALFFMNNKNDVCFKNNGLSFYFIAQYSPSMGKPADYIEKIRGTSQASNVLEQIYLNYSPIFKSTEDGLVTTIDAVNTMSAMMGRPAQTININQGGGLSGCEGSGCGQSVAVEAKMKEMEATIAHQKDTISSLVSSLRTVDHIAAELGVKEQTISLFESMPNDAQRIFVATCILEAETIEDINNSFEESKIFGNVPDYSSNMTAEKLSAEFHRIISEFNDFVTLATDENSDDGATISDREMKVMSKILSRFRKYQIEMTKFVNDNKSK